MVNKSRPVSQTRGSTTFTFGTVIYTVRCLFLLVFCPQLKSQLVVNEVLALSKRNTNAAEIIIFLHRLSSVLVEYFKELEEESIRDNFVIIYELMDEMMDFGYPQTTESKILQE